MNKTGTYLRITGLAVMLAISLDPVSGYAELFQTGSAKPEVHSPNVAGYLPGLITTFADGKYKNCPVSKLPESRVSDPALHDQAEQSSSVRYHYLSRSSLLLFPFHSYW